MFKLMPIVNNILLKEDAFKDYTENLAKYDPEYIKNPKSSTYPAMNKLNSLLLNSYKQMPPEARYQSAMIYKKWFMDKYPENQKIKRWDPDNDAQLRLFNGIGVSGLTGNT